MPDPIKAGFAVGILVLAVALFVPTLIDGTQENASETLQLSENESRELTDTLTVRAENFSEANDNATVHFENSRTFASNSTFVNASQNGNVMLSGDRINVSLSTVDADGATVSVSYPPMFGWDDGSRTFLEHAGLIIAMLALAIVLVMVAVVFL